MGLSLLIGGGLAMRLGTVNAFFPFDHVGFRHVQAAMLASQHGAGLQIGRRLGFFGLSAFCFLGALLEIFQTIVTPEPNTQQNSQ